MILYALPLCMAPPIVNRLSIQYDLVMAMLIVSEMGVVMAAAGASCVPHRRVVALQLGRVAARRQQAHLRLELARLPLGRRQFLLKVLALRLLGRAQLGNLHAHVRDAHARRTLAIVRPDELTSATCPFPDAISVA